MDDVNLLSIRVHISAVFASAALRTPVAGKRHVFAYPEVMRKFLAQSIRMKSSSSLTAGNFASAFTRNQSCSWLMADRIFGIDVVDNELSIRLSNELWGSKIRSAHR
jgi:hypothetical protein